MELAAAESQHTVDDNDQDEDDAEYYRKEVGTEPEHDLFTAENPRKRKSDDDNTNNPRGFKKMRLDKKIKKKYQTNQDKKFNNQNQGNENRKFNKNNKGNQNKKFKNSNSNQDRFKKSYRNDNDKKAKKTYQVNQNKKFKKSYQANQRNGKRHNK